MPMLHLLRHAKSSWKVDVEDRQRRLSGRGRKAAQQTGRDLPVALGPLDLVLCSNSRRTRETLELVLAEFPQSPPILIEEGLYLADAQTLLARLARLDARHANVLVIGHNPGLHDLALALAATNSPRFHALAAGKFPTTARASFRIETAWPAIASQRHPLLAYVTPSSSEGSAA